MEKDKIKEEKQKEICAVILPIFPRSYPPVILSQFDLIFLPARVPFPFSFLSSNNSYTNKIIHPPSFF